MQFVSLSLTVVERTGRIDYYFLAIVTGLIYPAFGIVYGIAIQSFQLQDRHSLRRAGDRSALWFFLIAVASTVAIALQNFCLARGAAMLVRKLRSQSFRAILRQDSTCFVYFGWVFKADVWVFLSWMV